MVLELRSFRGMGDNLQITNTSLPPLWEELFWRFDAQHRIEVEGAGSAHDSRTLKISDVGNGSLTRSVGEVSGASSEESE